DRRITKQRDAIAGQPGRKAGAVLQWSNAAAARREIGAPVEAGAKLLRRVARIEKRRGSIARNRAEPVAFRFGPRVVCLVREGRQMARSCESASDPAVRNDFLQRINRGMGSSIEFDSSVSTKFRR